MSNLAILVDSVAFSWHKQSKNASILKDVNIHVPRGKAN